MNYMDKNGLIFLPRNFSIQTAFYNSKIILFILIVIISIEYNFIALNDCELKAKKFSHCEAIEIM